MAEFRRTIKTDPERTERNTNSLVGVSKPTFTGIESCHSINFRKGESVKYTSITHTGIGNYQLDHDSILDAKKEIDNLGMIYWSYIIRCADGVIESEYYSGAGWTE